MPLSMFRRPSLVGANVAGLLLGATFFSTFFFLSLYMQQVLGYSARTAGLGYVLLAVVVVAAAVTSQELVTRFGARRVLATGLGLTGAGIGWFVLIDAGGSYLVDLAPGFVLAGAGFGLSFVPVSIAALHRVPEREVGAASGLINSSQEIGGAIGIAVLVTVAAAVSGTIGAPEDLVLGLPRGVRGGGGAGADRGRRGHWLLLGRRPGGGGSRSTERQSLRPGPDHRRGLTGADGSPQPLPGPDGDRSTAHESVSAAGNAGAGQASSPRGARSADRGRRGASRSGATGPRRP